jgi:1,4-dihydroxy-2-naphthoate octaprenyltransferase
MASVGTWIEAFRLRTLPLAFSSILMGTFVAVFDGYFDAVILILTLLTTLFLQVLSNLANDYGDAASGVDSEERIGPARTVHSGRISKLEMKKALYISSALSLASGLSLLFYAFGDNWEILLVFLGVGILAIWAAIKYTVGNNPYGYAGLGDLFVMIFFGLVGVIGTYYLHAQTLTLHVWLPALSSGFFAVGVLNVNNIRDIESDKKAGKKSIPVRIGKEKAVIYHLMLLANGLAMAFIFHMVNDIPWWYWAFMLSTPLFMINAKAAMVLSDQSLDPYLKQLAISSLIFTLLFGIGINLSGWL